MHTFTLEGAIDWIQGARYKGQKNGLENTRELLRALGNPEKSFRCVHIAGTNGKGSTASMVERVLRESGYRTGLYTSPYLCRYQERVRTDGVPIEDEALMRIVSRLADISDELTARGVFPTTFELGTALCFEYFREKGVEVAVVEVGLGGRLDSTNVIVPEVSLLAAIGLDHTKVLGDTITEIAGEKAGIIKEGVPVVAQTQDAEILNVFRRVAAEKNSSLEIARYPEVLEQTAYMSLFAMELEGLGRSEYQINLPGQHQLKNASLALNGLNVLRGRGLDKITQETMCEGLKKAQWPGRIEWVDGVLLDGAHNPQGAQSLKEYLDAHFRGTHITLLTGMMQDKQIEDCAKILAPLADLVVATQVDYERAAQAQDVADIFARYGAKATMSESSLPHALELAREKTPADGITVCAGSLYVAGDVRNLLKCDNGCL